jgi:hypothetical protein
MSAERERFLNLIDKPGRITMYEASHFFGCAPHDVPILVSTGLLKPLGKPMPNSVKFFATETVKELSKDAKWLAKATITINEHWKFKNARAKENTEQFSSQGEPDHSGKSAMQRA